MLKDIKTREVIKDIKVIDKAADVSAYSKNAFIKSKDTAEQTQQSRHNSATEYATDNISSYAKFAAAGAVHGTKKCLKNPYKGVKNSLNKAKEHFKGVKQLLPKERKKAAEQATKTAEKAQKTADTLQAKAEQAKKTAENAQKSVTEAKRKLQQTRQAGRQTVQSAKKTVKTAKQKGIKTTGKGTVKAAKKSVKTAEKSAKVAVKTAKTTAKNAQIAAKAAVKAAIIAKKASIVATKAAIVATKVVAKATLAAIKAAVLAIKGLIALIVAGGWIVILIIIIICLIALLVGSIFGIFFSGEDSGVAAGRIMPDVVAELTTEFYAQVDEIKDSNSHDVLEMDAMAINWLEILAIYAVKLNTDSENPVEVATLDDDKVNQLRDILNDTVSLSHSTRTESQERTIIDEDGEKTTETVTVKILTITFEHKTVDEMAEQYGFNQTQKEQLRELLDPQYATLWAALFGGFAPGGGIGIPDGSFIPTGIFAWVMGEGFPITSLFGYRADPFTGEISYHSGIDIEAPTGTPIFAAADGTVSVANSTDSWGGGWGFFVRIEHEGGYSTLYAHCSQIAVVIGQEVKQGEVIGYIGSTGRSTGPHLHWEIYRNGVRVNPLDYFE